MVLLVKKLMKNLIIKMDVKNKYTLVDVLSTLNTN